MFYLLALVAAIVGQVLLERHNLLGFGPFAVAIVLFLALLRRNALASPAELAREQAAPWPPPAPRWMRLLSSLVLLNAAGAFCAAAGNTWRWYGVLAWVLALACLLLIFWERSPARAAEKGARARRMSLALALTGLILCGAWFRSWRLEALPPEMNIDHVANLVDLHELELGQRPVFFERNNGREPLVFYWTLLFTRALGVELKFPALKLSVAGMSLLALPGVYLLGKELFGRWVGWWAALFMAVSSWPVLLSRIGLRSISTPVCTTWALLFLFRGLRHGRRNDFVLLGLALGVGLYGYTAFRIMPLAVVTCWVLAWRATRAVERPRLWRNALLTILVALVVFIPLGRYAVERPDEFWYRSLSRVNEPGRPYQESVLVTFMKNLLDLAAMFNWQGDVVWVAHWKSLGPMLDPTLGALFILGLLVLLWRGRRQRDVLSLLLLAAGGFLLLPSALSLAFPSENPSAMRASGAIPVVMVCAAVPIGLGLETAWKQARGRQRAWAAGAALLVGVSVLWFNGQRIFVDYARQYDQETTNTTEIAAALQDFVRGGGDLDNAYVVKGYPYWLDTRGVGIELGQFGWDNDLIVNEQADRHVSQGRPRLYVLRAAESAEDLAYLQRLFPSGQATLYPSRYPGEDLLTFYVP